MYWVKALGTRYSQPILTPGGLETAETVTCPSAGYVTIRRMKEDSRTTRFGVSLDDRLLRRFDSVISRKGYANRSEAIRDLIRDSLVEEEWEDEERETVGTLTLVYDHGTRELTDHLTDLQHSFHKQVISSLHVHLDQHNCLEVLVLRGKSGEIRRRAELLASVKGVKHGKLTMTSTGKQL